MGAAGGAIARYRFLRPGGYRFQILAAHVSGEPLGRSSELALRVQAPLWQRPWLWILGALGLVAAVAFGVRRLTKHRMQRKLAELDRQRALESERTRIAQDIHDDLGAGLAQIVMLSELAQMDAPEQDPRRAQLEEIGSRAQDAGRKLDEIVWAINPAHDSAEDLVGYLARFAQGYLSLAQIRFRLDVPPALPEIGLTSRQRHQIFLAAKEAIHNAVKHGAPSEITVMVRMVDECLVITVTDDGCGFADTEQIVTARGSANMKNRMEKIGGSFQRQSRIHGGTSVTFQLPLNCIVP
jgi:signal transduction histidine kinase